MGDGGWVVVGDWCLVFCICICNQRVVKKKKKNTVDGLPPIAIAFWRGDLCLYECVWRSPLSEVDCGKGAIVDFLIRDFTHHHIQWQQYCINVCGGLLSARLIVGRELSSFF